MAEEVRSVRKISELLWLVFLVAFTFFLKIALLGSTLNEKIEFKNTLDSSWMIDMVERFLHEYIAGRDFFFTYGPIYQFIQALPSLALNISSYNSILFADILLFILSTIIFFLLAKLIVENKNDLMFLSTIYLFLFVLSGFIDANNSIRTVVPILFSLIYFKFIYYPNKRSKTYYFAILAVPAVAGAYVFDLFLTCIAIIAFFGIWKIYTFKIINKKNVRKILLIYSFEFLLVFLIEIALSFILTKNMDYLFNSLRTVSEYKFIMNIPLSPAKSYLYFIFPLLLLFYLFLQGRREKKVYKNIIIIFSITAFIGLRFALIRTDDSHIISAAYPSIIALITIAFLKFKNKTYFKLFFLVLIAITLWKGDNFQSLSLSNFKKTINTVKDNPSFFDSYTLSQNYYLKPTDFNYISKLTKDNPGNVWVYPYENYLLNISNQTFNTYFLQFYEYSNSSVEERAVLELSKSPPKFIVYSVDGKGVVSLDNIPNFSRNSLLTKWIINNYKVHRNFGNYLILRNDNSGSIYKDKDCNLFSINPKAIRENGLMDLLKPSTYYLGDENNLRLPITNSNKDVLIFNGFSDPVDMENLINSNVNFSIYIESREDNLSVLKKYPFPLITKVHKNLKVNCY